MDQEKITAALPITFEGHEKRTLENLPRRPNGCWRHRSNAPSNGPIQEYPDDVSNHGHGRMYENSTNAIFHSALHCSKTNWQQTWNLPTSRFQNDRSILRSVTQYVNSKLWWRRAYICSHLFVATSLIEKLLLGKRSILQIRITLYCGLAVTSNVLLLYFYRCIVLLSLLQWLMSL